MKNFFPITNNLLKKVIIRRKPSRCPSIVKRLRCLGAGPAGGPGLLDRARRSRCKPYLTAQIRSLCYSSPPFSDVCTTLHITSSCERLSPYFFWSNVSTSFLYWAASRSQPKTVLCLAPLRLSGPVQSSLFASATR